MERVDETRLGTKGYVNSCWMGGVSTGGWLRSRYLQAIGPLSATIGGETVGIELTGGEMSEGWQWLLLGALFSIPVGIGVNLATPSIGRWIDRRNASSATRRAASDQKFRDEAARLAKDRSALYPVLLEALLRIAYISAIFGALAGGLAIVGQLVFPLLELSAVYFFYPLDVILPSLVFAMSQLAALIGTILVLNIARQAVVLLREVRAVRSLEPALGTAKSVE